MWTDKGEVPQILLPHSFRFLDKRVFLVMESKHHIKSELLKFFYKWSSEINLIAMLRNFISMAKVFPVLGDVEERAWRSLL